MPQRSPTTSACHSSWLQGGASSPLSLADCWSRSRYCSTDPLLELAAVADLALGKEAAPRLGWGKALVDCDGQSGGASPLQTCIRRAQSCTSPHWGSLPPSRDRTTDDWTSLFFLSSQPECTARPGHLPAAEWLLRTYHSCLSGSRPAARGPVHTPQPVFFETDNILRDGLGYLRRSWGID